jgi:hypothetical protein
MLGETKEKKCQWNPANEVLKTFMKDRRVAAAAAKKHEGSNVLATSSSMDGPSVAWTVNDLFKFDNRSFLLYHCMFSGYDFCTPLGALIGGFVMPRTSKFAHLTTIQAAGTGSAIAGGIGLTLGFLALVGTAYSKDPAIPFDDDGIKMRVDGLSHNYRVRAMDLGVWVGTAAAGGAMLAVGGPAKLGLSVGSLGRVQGLALGSVAGSIAATVVIETTK